MGKNKDIKSLISLLVGTIVHEIVAKHTNRSESKHFLDSEAIEYGGQAEKFYEKHSWNDKDKEHIRQKAVGRVLKIMTSKYPDISFDKKEAEAFADKII